MDTGTVATTSVVGLSIFLNQSVSFSLNIDDIDETNSQ
jgi:hypothetical protein